MRVSVLVSSFVLFALLASALLSVSVSASSSDLSADAELFLAEFASAGKPQVDQFGQPIAEKVRPAGSIQRGGKRIIRGPNFRKGAADGSTLPPYDPFGINFRYTKIQERKAEIVKARVAEENKRELLKSMHERAKRRIAIEKREAAEAKREAAREAAANAEKTQVETDLLEVQTEADSTVDAEAELDAEAEVDADAESDAEVEAEVDAAESAADFAEMQAEAETEGEAETDAETDAESETDAEVDVDAEVDSALVEKKNAVDQVTPIVHHRRLKRRLQPSSHVTYDRESLVDEAFDNKDNRAVFARRARGREITRFQRLATSSAGQAVVNGVTRTPCGKEITDKGLFGAVVLANPGPTVEAANPEPPVMKDSSGMVIKKLPVVPQFKEKKVADEYGDE